MKNNQVSMYQFQRPSAAMPRANLIGITMIRPARTALFLSSIRPPGLTPPQQLSLSDASTMLYFVGLGLSDETDITVKGLEIVKHAERVYLEAYTSILLVDKEKLVCTVYQALRRCHQTSKGMS